MNNFVKHDVIKKMKLSEEKKENNIAIRQFGAHKKNYICIFVESMYQTFKQKKNKTHQPNQRTNFQQKPFQHEKMLGKNLLVN